MDGSGETRPRANGHDHSGFEAPGSNPLRRAAHIDQPDTGGISAARAGQPEGSETILSAAWDDATTVLERAPAEAQFVSARIREHAAQDAERARSAILDAARAEARALVEEVREASRAKDSLPEESREHVLSEGMRLREQAAADARQILADAEKTADALARQARSDASRIRDLAVSEAERVKSAILDHAREAAEAERVRLREQAMLDGEEARAQIVELAEQDAERIRAEARQERLDILDEAEEEAVRLHLEASASAGTAPTDDSGTMLLRARDVGSREFPQARRGFDPESVRRWLKIVEMSYRLLEEELQRARREWERALEVLDVTRLHLGPLAGSAGQSLQPGLEQRVEAVWGAWEQSMQGFLTIERPRPAYDLPSLLVRASQLERRLDKCLFGYSPSQVQHLLDELTAELARLEHQVGLLTAENDELRGRLLTQVSRPLRENLGVLRLLPPEALVSRPALGASPASEEGGPSTGPSVELDLLEHQVGALRAENDELKGRLLTQVSRPALERLVVLGLLPRDAVKETSALGASPPSNGTEPRREEMVG